MLSHYGKRHKVTMVEVQALQGHYHTKKAEDRQKLD